MDEPKRHWRLRRYRKPGTPPGTLTQEGPQRELPHRCQVLLLTAAGLREAEQVDACAAPEDWEGILWLDVAGLPSSEDLERLRDGLGLHPLALEDVVTGGQRPKLDTHDGTLFLVLSRPFWEHGQLRLEQVSLFLGERFVVSIHEAGTDLFEPVRVRPAAGLAGDAGARLFHALVDLVVDQGFPVLDGLGELAEELEAHLLERPSPEVLGRIHRLKRAMLKLRRDLWPAREALGQLMRPGTPHGIEALFPYWKDVYDHALYQLEMVEA